MMWLLACVGGDAPAKDSLPPVPTDDTQDTQDTSPQDTGELCDEPLRALVDGVEVSGLSFEPTASLGRARHVELTLQNPCRRDLLFGGHPEEWLVGDGFSLDALPPVLLGPNEEATLRLAFTPGEAAGAVTGSFILPYGFESGPLDLSLSAEVRGPQPLVLVGDGYWAYSADLGQTVQFTQETSEVHSNELRRGVCFGLGQFIATGGSDTRLLWVSPDGLTWSPVDQGPGWAADCSASDDRIVVAGGSHMLATSDDGADWTLSVNFGDHFRTVAYGDGVWVAGGDEGVGVTSDGETWTDLQDLSPGMDNIVYGHGVFVAAGDAGVVATSADRGASWSLTTVGGDDWGSALFDGQRFYLGNGTEVWRSQDGSSWELVNGSGGILPVAAPGAALIGVGQGALHISTDGGFSWETRASIPVNSFNDAALGAIP